MKQTVQIDGKAHEIDIPGVIAESAVEELVQERLTRFAKGHVKVDGLDDAGKKALAEKLGLKLATEGGATGGDITKQVESAQVQWEATRLTPVLTELQTLKSELEGGRRDRLYDAIITAAAKAGVLDSLLDATGGSKAAIVAMHEHRFVFDEKAKGWFVKGADGTPALATNPKTGKLYKDPAEFVSEWVKLPTSKPFVGMTMMQGPDLGSGGRAGTGTPGVVERDPLAFGRNLEAIASGKAVVQ